MERKNTKELLPVITAFAEGKQIQYFNGSAWIDMKYPSFNYKPSLYRIKPEPKYRPFKTKAECWKEMGKHPSFGWLKNKKNGDVALICNVCQDKEVLIIWALNHVTNYASDLFNDWVFADDAPFGIKED